MIQFHLLNLLIHLALTHYTTKRIHPQVPMAMLRIMSFRINQEAHPKTRRVVLRVPQTSLNREIDQVGMSNRNKEEMKINLILDGELRAETRIKIKTKIKASPRRLERKCKTWLSQWDKESRMSLPRLEFKITQPKLERKSRSMLRR